MARHTPIDLTSIGSSLVMIGDELHSSGLSVADQVADIALHASQYTRLERTVSIDQAGIKAVGRCSNKRPPP